MKVAQAFAEAAVVALPNEDGCAAGVAALPERLVDALCRFPIGSVRGKQSLKKDASQRAEEQKYRRTTLRREIQMPTDSFKSVWVTFCVGHVQYSREDLGACQCCC